MRNKVAGKHGGGDCRGPKSEEERNLDEGNGAENSDFFFFLRNRKEAGLLAIYQVIVVWNDYFKKMSTIVFKNVIVAIGNALL